MALTASLFCGRKAAGASGGFALVLRVLHGHVLVKIKRVKKHFWRSEELIDSMDVRTTFYVSSFESYFIFLKFCEVFNC